MRSSVRVTIGGATMTLDDKAACKKCGEQIVHVAKTDIWLHVGFVKGQKTFQDYRHTAR